MKIIIEVVATNMVSGHVAISQKDVDLTTANLMPNSKKQEYVKSLIKQLNSSGFTVPKKVGDILISRSFVIV